MWLKLAFEINNQNLCYEEKILEADVERSVRKNFYLKGTYSPNPHQVNVYIKKIMSKLKEEYDGFDNIRRKTHSISDLSHIAEKYTNDIMKHTVN